MIIDLAIQRKLLSNQREFLLDISLQSNASRIALLGPSGSGKTLTVQAIAGLLRPDAGHIRVKGITFFDAQQSVFLSAQQRQLAYLLQDYGLFPHLTVTQNIGFGLTKGYFNWCRKVSLPDVAMRWVEAFELGAILQSYPDQISGGQKQRVALARALSTSPSMLLLDEPLAALDTNLRQKMRDELAALQQQLDIPTILITHDLDDAVALADQIYQIDNGKIVSDRPSCP
ncbi:ATP-binding cassette domain-containing protein [Alcaligenaceae bacterium]|nr:ATP-binding cassette domain-containing protein [Alcaligenaceae bacterium]